MKHETLEDRKHTVIKQSLKAAVISTPHFNPDTQTENFYYNLLVLFVPFPSEDQLIQTGETAEAAFIRATSMGLLKGITPHRKNELNAAFQRAQLAGNLSNPELGRPEVFSDQRDRRNEGTSQDEYQNLRENLQDIESEEFEDDELVDANQMLPELERHERAVTSLKHEQSEFFHEIANMLKNQAHNIVTPQIMFFITGAGGTGKSFLLQMIRDRIRLILDGSQTRSALVLAAPTGIAARNINGTSLHRAFKLPVERGGVGRFRPVEGEMLNTFRDQYKRLRWIFIDEISMLSTETLNMIHKRSLDLVPSDTERGPNRLEV